MLRVGIVGLGVMGRNHLRVLSDLPDVEIVGIVEASKVAPKVANSIPVFDSVENLLLENLDYCIVSTPTAVHEEVSSKLIENGIHVLIEKPISHDLRSAKRIVDKAKNGGVIAAVGHIERFNSAVHEARRRISNGEIGNLYQISTIRVGPFPSRISDVGVVMDLATHDIDLTSWLSDSSYQSVDAKAVYRSGRTHEDMVVIVGQLRKGIIVNHIVNWLSPMKERRIVVTGEKGSFVIDTLTSDLSHYENGTVSLLNEPISHFKGVTQGNFHRYAFEKPEALRVEHENFRKAVLGEEAQIVSLEDGCKNVEVAEAVLRSINESKEVLL